MAKLSIRDLELNNKYLFVASISTFRFDSGLQILDDTRIKETLPTLEYALRHHAKVIVASHLGTSRKVSQIPNTVCGRWWTGCGRCSTTPWANR